ncbi:MAG: restriction endonuclease subunit S [Chloroflexi bacterium]|nr:restriction endonuclease subunit S [Chloroflexota bacterium]
MTGEWTTYSLGELCQIEIGGTPARKDSTLWDVGKKTNNVWLSIADLRETVNKRVTDSKEYISDEAAKKANLVREGTLLVSFKLTLGRLAYAGRNLFTNEAIAALTILDDRRIGIDYLYWYLTFFDWQKAAEGDHKIKGKTLNKAKLKLLPVLVPPLPEQELIVRTLDETVATIATLTANTQKNLANALELFESELNRLLSQFGDQWVEKKLGEVCEIESNLVDPRDSKYIDQPHIGAGNIVSRTGELVAVQTAREEKLRSGKYVFDSRMVLYSKIRPYLMKVCRPPFDGLCSADVYPLLPVGSFISRNFLFYLLLSKHFTDYAISGSARAGMPKINRKHLFAYKRPFPPPDQQNHISSTLDIKLDEIRRLEGLYNKKLVVLTELKQSILNKTFSRGATVGKNSNDRILNKADL